MADAEVEGLGSTGTCPVAERRSRETAAHPENKRSNTQPQNIQQLVDGGAKENPSECKCLRLSQKIQMLVDRYSRSDGDRCSCPPCSRCKDSTPSIKKSSARMASSKAEHPSVGKVSCKVSSKSDCSCSVKEILPCTCSKIPCSPCFTAPCVSSVPSVPNASSSKCPPCKCPPCKCPPCSCCPPPPKLCTSQPSQPLYACCPPSKSSFSSSPPTYTCPSPPPACTCPSPSQQCTCPPKASTFSPKASSCPPKPNTSSSSWSPPCSTFPCPLPPCSPPACSIPPCSPPACSTPSCATPPGTSAPRPSPSCSPPPCSPTSCSPPSCSTPPCSIPLCVPPPCPPICSEPPCAPPPCSLPSYSSPPCSLPPPSASPAQCKCSPPCRISCKNNSDASSTRGSYSRGSSVHVTPKVSSPRGNFSPLSSTQVNSVRWRLNEREKPPCGREECRVPYDDRFACLRSDSSEACSPSSPPCARRSRTPCPVTAIVPAGPFISSPSDLSEASESGVSCSCMCDDVHLLNCQKSQGLHVHLQRQQLKMSTTEAPPPYADRPCPRFEKISSQRASQRSISGCMCLQERNASVTSTSEDFSMCDVPNCRGCPRCRWFRRSEKSYRAKSRPRTPCTCCERARPATAPSYSPRPASPPPRAPSSSRSSKGLCPTPGIRVYMQRQQPTSADATAARREGCCRRLSSRPSSSSSVFPRARSGSSSNDDVMGCGAGCAMATRGRRRARFADCLCVCHRCSEKRRPKSRGRSPCVCCECARHCGACGGSVGPRGSPSATRRVPLRPTASGKCPVKRNAKRHPKRMQLVASVEFQDSYRACTDKASRAASPRPQTSIDVNRTHDFANDVRVNRKDCALPTTGSARLPRVAAAAAVVAAGTAAPTRRAACTPSCRSRCRRRTPFRQTRPPAPASDTWPRRRLTAPLPAPSRSPVRMPRAAPSSKDTAERADGEETRVTARERGCPLYKNDSVVTVQSSEPATASRCLARVSESSGCCGGGAPRWSHPAFLRESELHALPPNGLSDWSSVDMAAGVLLRARAAQGEGACGGVTWVHRPFVPRWRLRDDSTATRVCSDSSLARARSSAVAPALRLRAPSTANAAARVHCASAFVLAAARRSVTAYAPPPFGRRAAEDASKATDTSSSLGYASAAASIATASATALATTASSLSTDTCYTLATAMGTTTNTTLFRSSLSSF